jgi:hypothetical protein
MPDHTLARANDRRSDHRNLLDPSWTSAVTSHTMKCGLLRLAGFLAVFAATGPVWAQEADAPKAAADSIDADIAAGRFKEACAALKQRYIEDAVPATLYRLAECYDKWGRLATAAVHYDDYLVAYDKLTDTSRKEERDHEEKASRRREELDKRIPKVILRVPRDAPDTTRVLRRTQDEGPLVPVAIGVPLLIDPGEHVLTTEVPGRVSVFTKFSVKEGENRNVEVQIPAASGKVDPTSKVKPLQPVPSLMPALESGVSGRRVAAYTLGGIGAVGVLGGIVTGAITWAQKSPIEQNCLAANPKICNPTGEGAKQTAEITGLVSTVAFPVGLVTLGAGIILYLTEPAPSKFGAAEPKIRVGAALGPGAGALDVGVRW